MRGISIRPQTLRKFKKTSIPETIQVRKIETKAKPSWFNIQKPNEESLLIRKLLRKEEKLKTLHDLEWIFSEILEKYID